MKKILSLIIILISIKSLSQDSTRVTLSTKARNVQALVRLIRHSEDTAYINLLNRWVKKYDVNNPPSGTTQVSCDSIGVTVIADLYDYAMNFPQGALAVGSDFASDVSSIRAANNYLDRLLDAIDAKMAAIVADARTKGREILTGKKQ